MILPKPKAVLFDWDDTIVNTWAASCIALNTTLVAMGQSEWTEEEIRRRSGLSAKDQFTQMFGDDWDKADKIYYDTFQKIIFDQMTVVDNAEATLKFLKDAKVYLGVVSNKRGDFLRQEAKHLNFAHYFSAIVGAGDAEKDKPDAAPLLMALRDSGISPAKDVWFIGDSHTDMGCAINAGCSGILIEIKTPPDELLFKNPPAHRIKGHIELMEFIRPYFT